MNMKNESKHPTQLDFPAIRKKLGDGPMRFAPTKERSVAVQIKLLTKKQRACFNALKSKWFMKNPKVPISDEIILRYARCSPGLEKFNEHAAWRVMKNMNPSMFKMKASDMETQLMTKTVFPVPGLKSSEGHDMMFLMPAKYFPKERSSKDVIKNLTYCIQTMVVKEHACTEGIGFVAYMNDWKFRNLSIPFCFRFMRLLQGKVPLRVRSFLFVNPPKWFEKMWNVFRPLTSRDFRSKVHFIQEQELPQYLMKDASLFAPDETKLGSAPTTAMVRDFLTYRKHVELPSVETRPDPPERAGTKKKKSRAQLKREAIPDEMRALIYV